jgi:hypothetical protein
MQERFQHLVLLGGPAQLGEWLVDTGFADRCSRELPPDCSADMIAILNGAGTDFQSIAGQLKPGGVLYYEWSRLGRATAASSPGRVTKYLQSLGLSVHGAYAVSPSFEEAHLFLPLNTPHALEWYVTSLYTALTLRQRLLEGVLSGTTGLHSGRFAAVAPFVAVVATRGRPESGIPAVLACPSISALLHEEPQDQIAPLLLTDGGNRATMLPFARGEQQPRLVVKIPKLPAFNDRTISEQKTLKRVRGMVDTSLSRSMPCPLGLTHFGNVSISVEGFLPGESMLRSSARWGASSQRQIENLELATDWICEFHSQTVEQVITWNENEYSGRFESLLHLFRQSYDTSEQEEKLFLKLRAQSDLMAEYRIPIVWQHRDFNIWNVFRNDRRVSVIDWEGGRSGLPLCDLLHFATHWNDAARRAVTPEERASNFEALFCIQTPGDALTRKAHQMVYRYIERLQVNRGFVPMLLVHTWLELLLRRQKQLQDMGDECPESREKNHYFQRLALLVKYADSIFDRTP